MSDTGKKDISVVIVNYNVRDLIDNCIASIYKANSGNEFSIEIFVVDNNSVDGSVSHIKDKYPGVNLIELEENIGFSKGNNIALQKVQGDYILILNPDTVLEEGTFIKLINFVKQNPSAGAVTSKLIKQDGTLDLACKRSFPTPSVAIPRMLGLSSIFPKSKIFAKYNLTYLDENKTHKVDAVCGAFMFIPKPVLDEIGLFDEDYFMYGEDIDLCFKMKQAGYDIFYFPEVTTIHLKGESTRKTNLSYVNNFYGAMRIFVKKNFTGSSKFLAPVLLFGIYYRSAFSYLKRLLLTVSKPVLDVILIFAALIVSVWIRFGIFPGEPYLFIITIYTLIWVFLLMIFGAYTRKHMFSLKAVFMGIFAGFFVNSSVTYFFKEYAFSREVVLTSTVFSLIALSLWRGVFRIVNFIKLRNILLTKVNLLVIGKSTLDENIEEKLSSKYNVIFYDDITIRKDANELKEIITIRNIEEVVFTDESFSNKDILNAMWSLKDRKVKFKILPSGKELILSKLHTGIDELELIEIEYNINNRLNIFLKRTFDLVLSSILLLTVYPVALLMSKISKGDLSRYAMKLLYIPRVFTGKYSFVGMPLWFDTTGNEYLGRKGLTGLIQIYYHQGMTEEEMNTYNIFYAKNQSLTLDMEILLKTLFSFLRRKK